MGKLTISMAIFNSYFDITRVQLLIYWRVPYRPKPFFEVEGSKSRNDQPLVLRSRAPGNPPGDGWLCKVQKPMDLPLEKDLERPRHTIDIYIY
jgi:hypothetical protein